MKHEGARGIRIGSQMRQKRGTPEDMGRRNDKVVPRSWSDQLSKGSVTAIPCAQPTPTGCGQVQGRGDSGSAERSHRGLRGAHSSQHPETGECAALNVLGRQFGFNVDIVEMRTPHCRQRPLCSLRQPPLTCGPTRAKPCSLVRPCGAGWGVWTTVVLLVDCVRSVVVYRWWSHSPCP